MPVLVEVFLDGKPIRANILDLRVSEFGWVKIEDLSLLKSAETVDIGDPEAAAVETNEDLKTSNITLPSKKLYGNVKVFVLRDELE